MAKEKIGVRETLITDLASRVYEEVKYVLSSFNENFCLDLNEELEDESKQDEMYIRIYNAIKESITLVELKILKDSNEDAGNFHILYKKLHQYFEEKLEEVEERDLDSYTVYDDETYLIIFKTMPGFICDPALKNKKPFDDRPKRYQPNFDKIQDAFKA